MRVVKHADCAVVRAGQTGITGHGPPLGALVGCELAQDIAQRFELLAGEHGLHVHLSLEQTVPHAVGDIALIERVLINLIENAIQHTPDRGAIGVTCRASGARVVISIADTGPGIAAADLPHLFTRSYPGLAQRVSGLTGLDSASPFPSGSSICTVRHSVSITPWREAPCSRLTCR